MSHSSVVNGTASKNPEPMDTSFATSGVVQTSLGMFFEVQGTKTIFKYSVTFKKSINLNEGSSAIRVKAGIEAWENVREQALRKDLFQKLLSHEDWAQFNNVSAETLYDGKSTFFSCECLIRHEKDVRTTTVEHKNDKYEITVKRLGQFEPQDTSDSKRTSLDQFLRFQCEKLSSRDTTNRGLKVEKGATVHLDTTTNLIIRPTTVAKIPAGLLQDTLARLSSSAGIGHDLLIGNPWLLNALAGLPMKRTDRNQWVWLPKNAAVLKAADRSNRQKEAMVQLQVLIGKTSKGLEWLPANQLSLPSDQVVSRNSYFVKQYGLNVETQTACEKSFREEFDNLREGLQKNFEVKLQQHEMHGGWITNPPELTYKAPPVKTPTKRKVSATYAKQEANLASTGQWSIAKDENTTFQEPLQLAPEQVIEFRLKKRESEETPDRDLEELRTCCEHLNTYSFKNFADADPEIPHRKREVKVAQTKLLGFGHGPQSVEALNEQLGLKVRPGDPSKVLTIVLPDKQPERYAQAKIWADCVLGVQSVCVIRPNNKGRIRLPENLAMKINLKAGGTNFRNDQLELPDESMVVGISVSHPPDNSVAGGVYPSVAAVVASSDKDYLNLPGSLRYQPNGVQEVVELEEMMKERLTRWIEKRKSSATDKSMALPQHIIVYRTGIGRQQYDKTVFKSELTKVQHAVNSFGLRPSKITVILVEKNHRTQVYKVERNKPGFVVTTKEGSDSLNNKGLSFYLKSNAIFDAKDPTPAVVTTTSDDANGKIEIQSNGSATSEITASKGPTPQLRCRSHYEIFQNNSGLSKEGLMQTVRHGPIMCFTC
ncbi:hypothetical protein EJ08DRAFT_147253 [Tothia fuscella]|uniref:Piwi domain-containing protein n=1 Tax=Tothia fuscella TaxID=1048955 RepID=A0A9P4U3Z6_9PEZI|nr:hypothetical protein EJ08DRAFT_147253 [Tothia fuscella]